MRNPAGTSVNTNGKTGSTIANLTITGSGTALLATGNMTGTAKVAGTTSNPLGLTAAGATAVRSVTMSGDGTTNPQRGVWLKYTPAAAPTIPAEIALAGDIEFTDTVIGNMNNTGFRVDGLDSGPAGVFSKTGNANINFSGSLTSDVANNGGIPSPIIDINSITNAAPANPGTIINLASTGAPSGSVIPNQILDVGGDGVVIEANDAGTRRSTLEA